MKTSKLSFLVPWLVLLLSVLPTEPQGVTVGMDGSVVMDGDDDHREEQSTSQQQQPQQRQQQQVPLQPSVLKQLEQKAFALQQQGQRQKALEVWNRILKSHPRNGNALLQTGLQLIESSDYGTRELGIQRVSQAFQDADQPIPMPTAPGMALAMLIGRYRWEQRDFEEAYNWLYLAVRAAQALGLSNTCAEASLATMLHPFPNSTQQADQMMEQYMQTAKRFLQSHPESNRSIWQMDEQLLARTVAGAGDDPFVHCILTLFHLSFYYRADVAQAAKLHIQVAERIWPQLAYRSPNVGDNKLADTTSPSSLVQSNKPCVTRKIRLGIASGFLIPQSSVSADFGGVMQRLDRNIFDITYIAFKLDATSPVDPFVYRHKDKDKVLILHIDPLKDSANGAWVTRFHSQIERLNLDVLLFLDLTMNPTATRVAMAKLAPVQANSHGHPLTSGVPAVDYYVSWGAAEIPTANEHYSEELVLLNSTVPHQYYVPRHNGERSMLDGGNFKNLAYRSTFSKDHGIPVDGNWYTCMQKPHKFMPEMDPLLCGILKQDEKARIILHEPDTEKLRNILERRLIVAGCQNHRNRIHLIPAQPHHRLLALYQVSTVILDSYPAGGCTTTREALELSKIVVTWPARLLGGRWSYAYYQILNDQVLNDHVIASSADEYVAKAVLLGTNATLRREMERRIQNSLPNLYESWDAVRSWQQVLLKIAPVEKRVTCQRSSAQQTK